MQFDIFTKDQQEFLKNNYDEYDKADWLTRKIYGAGNIEELPIKQLKDAMKNYLERISKDLEPFEAYNEIYREREGEILRNHGYERDDMYDTDTLKELVKLQDEMRKDAEAFEADMTPKKENALETMLKENSSNKENPTLSKFK